MKILKIPIISSFFYINLFAENSIGNSIGTQTIATAFTFGTTGFVFATLPFLFSLTNGLIKANSGHNAHSSNIISVMSISFLIHFCSCVFFLVAIKLLDILGALGKEANYYSIKIFEIFWTRKKDEVFALSGANGNIEDEGAYLQLFLVQEIVYWTIVIMPIVVLITSLSYGLVGAKKEQIHTNVLQIITWCAIASIIGYFVYILWASIASLALFIPDGDILKKTIQYYTEIIEGKI